MNIHVRLWNTMYVSLFHYHAWLSLFMLVPPSSSLFSSILNMTFLSSHSLFLHHSLNFLFFLSLFLSLSNSLFLPLKGQKSNKGRSAVTLLPEWPQEALSRRSLQTTYGKLFLRHGWLFFLSLPKDKNKKKGVQRGKTYGRKHAYFPRRYTMFFCFSVVVLAHTAPRSSSLPQNRG